MSQIKSFLAERKKVLIPIAILLVVAAVVGICFAIQASTPTEADKSTPSPTPSESQTEEKDTEKVEAQEIDSKDLQWLEEEGILTHIQNVELEKGKRPDWKSLTAGNNGMITGIEVDDSNIDYNKEGEYTAAYTITFDGDALRNYLQEHKISVSFDTEGDTVILKTSSAVTITGTETSKAEEEKEESSTSSSKTEGSSTQSSQQTENSKPSTSSNEVSSSSSETSVSSSTSSSGGTSSAHKHVWKDHTAKRWVSNIVTVVDEPEKTEKVTIYRMYWWDSKQWTETKDPDKFDEWYTKKFEWMVTYDYPYDMPPELYLGEDEKGNPQFTNDHSIISYYETIPAVTHEEDQGHYETYVDYQYCDCGAKK